MRVIVYGVGAIGGTVAAALAHAGTEVIGIAREEQRSVIARDGLTLRAPGQSFTARFDTVSDPSRITFGPDDVIALAMKSQDSAAAFTELAAAGVSHQSIFCLQNGVYNEQMALRRFSSVHGVTVMLPASYTRPGEVIVFAEPCFGMLDLGLWTGGSDDTDIAFAECCRAANIHATVVDDIQDRKYGKLIVNLKNILEALLGPGTDASAFRNRLQSEAESVLRAAGIGWRNMDQSEPRRAIYLRRGSVDGQVRDGGSTTQSLRRQSGSLETQFLNGEIAMLGRLHGIPTPWNAALTSIAELACKANAPVGCFTVEALEAQLRQHMAGAIA